MLRTIFLTSEDVTIADVVLPAEYLSVTTMIEILKELFLFSILEHTRIQRFLKRTSGTINSDIVSWIWGVAKL